MTKPAKDWRSRVEQHVSTLGAVEHYARANANAMHRASRGLGPDSSKPDTSAGMRCIVNISSTHVPAFCQDGYKNGYDLGKFRVGKVPKKQKLRELVDSALPVSDPDKICFGAAALSGTGIRFYGDICLVLKAGCIEDTTKILDRNSYDLMREPLSMELGGDPTKLKDKAQEISGEWSEVGWVAAVNVLTNSQPRMRRMTTGQLASGILNDEDYIEVLKQGSFEVKDLEIARISSAEASICSHIEDKFVSGSPATAAEILYVQQRMQAVAALAANNIRVAVSTTDGRTK